MFAIRDRNRKWWVLGAMGSVLGLVVLDETVVGVALPTIRSDLGMSAVTAHWVINAYLLVFTGLVAAGGKLGDIVDIRRLFIAGIAVFGLASTASGFAPNSDWIIATRMIQGIGAAAIFPTSIAIVTMVFPVEQRGLAFGIHTAIGGVFMSLGPLVGGFLTEALSWRWIFWVNLPLVVAAALVLQAAWTTPARNDRKARMDVAGLCALIAGLAGIILALMQVTAWGWASPATIVLAVVGVASLVVMVVVERRVAEPLIDVALFGNTTFAISNLVIYSGQFNKVVLIVFGALYLQDALGMSPLEAGTALVIAVIPTLFSSLMAGRLADRFGIRGPTLAGLAINTLALTWIAFTAAADSFALLVPAFLLWGLSLPFLYVGPRRAVMNTVPEAERGQAGGVNLTSQLLGGTVAMAIGSTLLTATGDFQIVFLTGGLLGSAVFVLAWFTLGRDGVAAAD